MLIRLNKNRILQPLALGHVSCGDGCSGLSYARPPRSKALPWNALPLWLCHRPFNDQSAGDGVSHHDSHALASVARYLLFRLPQIQPHLPLVIFQIRPRITTAYEQMSLLRGNKLPSRPQLKRFAQLIIRQPHTNERPLPYPVTIGIHSVSYTHLTLPTKA